ncbi:MAG: phenylacetate--CoA ligase family protein [Nitrospinales bacterium]
MSFLENLDEYRVGRITFPLSNYLYNRKNIIGSFKALGKAEHISEEMARELQYRRLTSVVGNAYRYVPFYREKFKKIGFEPQDLKELDDLKKIPPLSRQEVIDLHKDMVDARWHSSISYADNREGDSGIPIPFSRFRKHKLVRNTSSGSTGAPTIFYENGSRTALNWVHEMRLKAWFGVNPGAREARLVRLSTDYSPQNKVIRMRKALWNQLLLPGTNLSDPDYKIAIDGILEFQPKVIYGFPSALAGLAKYVKDNNIPLGNFRPAVMIGWAGPVYEHEEKIMKEAFNCQVSNNYGAREVGHVAGKCPQGQYHINQENLIVESEGTPAVNSDNAVGEILVTTIDDSPMPFIRYRMGDIGEIKHSECDCGRTLPVLTNFLGRTGEIFISKDGRMISPNFWCRFFFINKYSNAIGRFQVVYKKNKDLKIKIEKDQLYTDDVERFIKNGVKANFSGDTNLELEYVPKIEPQISGKYQMVVNEENM